MSKSTKVEFNDDLDALAHTWLEIDAVPELCVEFLCDKNCAQDLLGREAQTSENSDFRVFYILAFKDNSSIITSCTSR